MQMINKRLDEFLDKLLANSDLPGIAVSVGIGKESKSMYAGLAYCKAVGYKDLEKKEPLKPEHIFHMASVTKLFVGTAIMQLWEKGRIDIDKPVVKYLSYFRMKDERYRKITVRQLMSHTAGMPDVTDYKWDKPEIDTGALERYVRSEEVTERFLLWEPGCGKFAYSNMGYEVLGALIAAASGMTFEKYICENIFLPLKMGQSTLLSFNRGIYDSEKGYAENLCIPHIKNEKKEIMRAPHFPYNRAHGPSSTLTSNVFDMEKWALAHLHRDLLKASTYDMVWDPQAVVPNNGEQMCLSWFRREQNGHILYGHEGTDDGFRASFWICPALTLSIVVCSNLSGAPVKKVSKVIFDALTAE